MINFRKSGLNHQKPQFEKFQKSQWNAWIYAWKHENKCKSKGKMDLLAWREENLAKRQINNDKKRRRFALTESYGERKVRKLFEKVFDPFEKLVLKNVRLDFWLIETLGSIDQNRQRLSQKFWINFDWSKNSFDRSKFQKKKNSFEKNSPVFA